MADLPVYEFADLTGRRFSRLVVLRLTFRDWRNRCSWACRCDCGAIVDIESNKLLRGNTGSCGCFRVSHGYSRSGSVEYRTWKSMRARCQNPKRKDYKHYGARGIVLCERWAGRDGFLLFLADMGPRPSPNHSIDRIDYDGPYSPENCRWATKTEQLHNRRNTAWVTLDGERVCQTEAARMLGYSKSGFRCVVEKHGRVLSSAIHGKKRAA